MLTSLPAGAATFGTRLVMNRKLHPSTPGLLPMFIRRFSRLVRRLQNIPKGVKPEDGPPVDANGLYWGKFTKQEYEEAKKSVADQIKRLEQTIKGDTNVRENLGQMPQFPMRDANVNVTSLPELLAQTIKTTGPISLLAFMRQCLTHPEYGYYTTRDPLDTATGDFVTSPEISLMFGEMIGMWLFTVWQQQGLPSQIRLVEFGPGKGTLMHDMVTLFYKFASKVGVQAEIVMIEALPVLRQKQWMALCSENEAMVHDDANNWDLLITKWGFPIKWVNTEKEIDHADNVANYVFAHEFFDALPIKGFERTEDGWREFVVEHTPSVDNTQPKLEGATAEHDEDDPLLNTEFHLTVLPKETPSSLIPKFSLRFRDLPVGLRIEICPDAELYIMKMVQLLTPTTGAVLVMDYGIDTDLPPENSLRGIYQHKFVSPFAKPGDVDLSVDVDFRALKLLGEKHCDVYGAVEQGDWLHSLGLGYRVEQLLDRNLEKPEVQDVIYGAYRRLTDPEQMGKVYKFMAMLPKGSKAPVGFGGSYE